MSASFDPPKVGETLLYPEIVGAGRTWERVEFKPCRVTKVGRKYFYVQLPGWDEDSAKHGLDDWRFCHYGVVCGEGLVRTESEYHERIAAQKRRWERWHYHQALAKSLEDHIARLSTERLEALHHELNPGKPLPEVK